MIETEFIILKGRYEIPRRVALYGRQKDRMFLHFFDLERGETKIKKTEIRERNRSESITAENWKEAVGDQQFFNFQKIYKYLKGGSSLDIKRENFSRDENEDSLDEEVEED